MSDLASSIRERYLRTLDGIASSARKAGRPPESIRVVVAAKSQPVEILQAAVEAGIGIFGENYAEEAVEKIQALKSLSAAGPSHPSTSSGHRFAVEWHMIGHVQSRKAKSVVEHFALLHSLDSLKLAQRLDRFAAESGRSLPVLLEFNVGGEASKQGFAAPDESRWPELLPDVRAIAALPDLKVQGLMTMPPLSTDPQAARAYFRCLRRLRDFLAERIPEAEWRELSMGTSVDYPVAVEEGATLVRIGQAILGPRPEPGG